MTFVGKQVFRWSHQIKSYPKSFYSVVAGRNPVMRFSSVARPNVLNSPFISSVQLKNSTLRLSTKVDQVSLTDDQSQLNVLNDFNHTTVMLLEDVDLSLIQQSVLVAFCRGSKAKKAGSLVSWACVFPNKPELTCAASFPRHFSSNRPEFIAISKAIEQANVYDPSQSQPLFIFIRSTNAVSRVDVLKKYLGKYLVNGWKRDDGRTILDADVFADIVKNSGKRHIFWTHVPLDSQDQENWITSGLHQAVVLSKRQRNQ